MVANNVKFAKNITKFPLPTIAFLKSDHFKWLLWLHLSFVLRMTYIWKYTEVYLRTNIYVSDKIHLLLQLRLNGKIFFACTGAVFSWEVNMCLPFRSFIDSMGEKASKEYWPYWLFLPPGNWREIQWKRGKKRWDWWGLGKKEMAMTLSKPAEARSP